eukprot:scaffold10283_cov31-Tisochrysis_lutea.AAC.5
MEYGVWTGIGATTTTFTTSTRIREKGEKNRQRVPTRDDGDGSWTSGRRGEEVSSGAAEEVARDS